MRILVLEHEADAPAGLLAEWAVERGHALEVLSAPQLRAWPHPQAADAVVSLGSERSVHASREPWIARELELLRAAHRAGVPLLGICFGAQALAAALGGSVRRAPFLEIGWIAHREEAPAAPAPGSPPALIGPGPWLCWHEDVFATPPGARQLASSPAGPLAFVHGASVALQFHPEADLEIARRWVASARSRPRQPELDAEELTRRIEAGAEGARERALALFDRIAAHWAACAGAPAAP
ncbi:MAG TPA: gamma-glutamyl-gamma-aminobutyrate hydrolase family protein [Solirubrobacteraceae bacterium]|nr:gamma-glutamyl-gamma-aminobutyrate hydrolase family protein [Solirubrobacteraceae bacterium]